MTDTTLVPLSLVGGFLAGFASSLHCVGMCGGIASSLTMTLSPSAQNGARLRTLMLAQLGRVMAYVVAGGVLAALGSQAYFEFDRAEAHLILRWAGALVLVYIGLSVIGWAPSLAGFDRAGAGIQSFIATRLGHRVQAASPVMAGLVWGLLPCGMVYATLFYALLSGSAVSGAMIMLGFGLGTMPAVTAAALGMTHILALARRQRMRLAVGLAIIILGFASAALPWRTIAALCGLPLA
ncbi:sulfite exporter TauE/SafE family protein [Maricaulis sp. W15]|uniref:sulfite exporter TauE/SafE family protein n=1 Tax=Maricaulis sp. W15 TaxID=1772333 RepID=UPI000948B23E|nr:sulfite exporter TauE/SafE family protein [Maricaulis sp. W15]